MYRNQPYLYEEDAYRSHQIYLSSALDVLLFCIVKSMTTDNRSLIEMNDHNGQIIVYRMEMIYGFP